ncbi:MAG: SDR family NAD(P)-dependent oxidoreductase [Gammaproteobacteria bacterium]|nr:SDR family NAD(P)-dependent oxidoreductase [Gammaproteobacteria bacterium]
MQNYHPIAGVLRDKVILITGAGDGIGAKVSKSFASYGATVVLLGRTIAKLERVYDEIVSAGGPQPAIYPLNLEGAGLRDYQELATVIRSELGQLNGLLHNAALVGDLTSIELYDAAVWQQALQINLTAPFLLTQACLDLLRSSSNPRIVFSTHQIKSAYWGAYSVAKAGVERLMQILADELSGEHQIIHVNAIAPGDLCSPLIKRSFPGKDTSRLPAIENAIPTYIYLMSNDSDGVNGKILDGQGNILE